MIEKIYEISCDNCSHSINHIFYKPINIPIHIDDSITR